MPGVAFGASFEVSYNGVVIVPLQPQCAGSEAGCPLPTTSNNRFAGFALVEGVLPPQAMQTTADLTIWVVPDFRGTQVQNIIFDQITLSFGVQRKV